MEKGKLSLISLDDFNENIDSFIKTNADIITAINELRTLVDLEELDLPNLGITINNKIKELAMIFKNKKLSFYTGNNEIEQNFIGYTILHRFYVAFLNAMQLLHSYPKTFAEELDIKADELNEMSSGIKNRFRLKFQRVFNPSELESKITLKNEDLEISNKIIDYYLDLNEKIYDFTLQDNLIETIQIFIEKFFVTLQIYGIDASTLLKYFIEPDLKSLELAHLIAPLKKEVLETYIKVSESLKETLPNFGFEKIKRM